ncbi:histidine phosphatase family protein [Pedobacter sp. G11]|uniref:SixA phosphatase family protein n=1 Tax=Pedobacter sp. G11 TaxID=2482728 RepID=UPI000E2529A0|nr:histidine phosphatase family protein [Pedobacter sp. G11]AZI26213.1 histidine phosphatase family protein [Pedobacter sp. G11]RYD75880.1 MAG: histidine phosphatase family protein [Sphingobacteriales bacterium]
MAKQLLLVRHGKSDWGNLDLKDFDRPLNKRGKENAPEMAERLVQRGFKFDLIVSSPAKRAKSTAKFFAEAYQVDDIQYEESIYEANTTALLKVINGLDDSAETVIMFGHNPGFTDLANELSDADIYNIPTAGMVLMSFPFDSWKMVSRGTGELVFFDYPKNSDEI